MKLVEILKSRAGALKVADIAKILGVMPQNICPQPRIRFLILTDYNTVVII